MTTLQDRADVVEDLMDVGEYGPANQQLKLAMLYAEIEKVELLRDISANLNKLARTEVANLQFSQ